MDSPVGCIGLVGCFPSSADGPPLLVMTSVLRRLVLSGLFMLAGAVAALSQPTGHRSLDGAPSIAIVNVNLIRMDRERVDPGQTVLVRGYRIAAIGAVGEVVVPDGTTVIDGAGTTSYPD